MNNDTQNNQENEKKGGKMLRRNISIDEDLWLAVQKKTGGFMSISAVIRELLKRWIAGEIDIFNDKK